MCFKYCDRAILAFMIQKNNMRRTQSYRHDKLHVRRERMPIVFERGETVAGRTFASPSIPRRKDRLKMLPFYYRGRCRNRGIRLC